jgi:adenylate cyclase
MRQGRAEDHNDLDRRAADLIAARWPLAIDTMMFTGDARSPVRSGCTMPARGAARRWAQVQLERKMRALAAGDMSRPVVAIGLNRELFDGRNLALRLARMGFTEVYWHRGGRDAWEVAGLEEAPLDVQEW